MLLNIIKQLNWVDVFVLIILFRIAYISRKAGLPTEFFKLLGTVLAIYISLHYYTALSDLAKARAALGNLPLDFLDFLSFVILAIIGYLVFFALRQVFCHFIKMEALPRLDKWGGFLAGMGRGVLFIGLIIFMLVISSISYLNKSAQRSYSGERLFKIAPAVYSSLWYGLMSKFMSKEKFNKTVTEVQADFERS